MPRSTAFANGRSDVGAGEQLKLTVVLLRDDGTQTEGQLTGKFEPRVLAAR